MADRDPEIEKTIEDIRKTAEEAHQASKEQIDVTSEVDRLFLLYQAGHVVDQGKTNDTLLVARAKKKLDLLQFGNLAKQVKIVGKHFDQKKESAKYQAALWSLTGSKGTGWDLADPVEFTPNRNENNEPIDSGESLPDVSELLPESFSDGSQSPMATPIADMMRSQEANEFQTANTERLEKMIGKFGLRFPDFKAASYTNASERELDTYQYHKLGVDDLTKNLQGNPQYASHVRDLDPSLFSGNTNYLGQPKPDEDEARLWAEKIRQLHESRVAKLAEKHGAAKATPPFAETKEGAKNYTQEAIQAIQGSPVWRIDTPEPTQPTIEKPQPQSQKDSPDPIKIHQPIPSNDKQNSPLPPPFAANKESAKNYTQEAIESIQKSQIWGTSVPQSRETPGAYSASSVDVPPTQTDPGIEAPPVQTPENRSDGNGNGNGNKGMGWLDWLQLGLDGAGVVEPTPFSDLANAGISLGRAAFDPQNAGQHLTNAGISLVSTIPYAGDIAKLAKGYGKGGKALGNSIEHLGSSRLGKKAYELFGGTKMTTVASGEAIGGGGGGGGSGGGGSGGGGSGGGGTGIMESGPDDSSGGFGQSSSILIATTIGLIGAFKALHSWVIKTADSGKELIESQRNLALYSGELSNAFQKSDTDKVFRDIRKADYLDSSAAGLAGAQSDYQDAVQFSNAPHERFNNDWSNAMTQLGTITVYLQSFMDFKGLLLRGVYAIVDATKENKPGDPTSGIEALFQKMDADKAAEDAKNNPPLNPAPRLPADAKLPVRSIRELLGGNTVDAMEFIMGRRLF